MDLPARLTEDLLELMLEQRMRLNIINYSLQNQLTLPTKNAIRCDIESFIEQHLGDL